MGPMKYVYKKTQKEDQNLNKAQNEILKELNKVSAARTSFDFLNLVLQRAES